MSKVKKAKVNTRYYYTNLNELVSIMQAMQNAVPSDAVVSIEGGCKVSIHDKGRVYLRETLNGEEKIYCVKIHT